MDSTPDPRNRWALLIGINEYPKLRESAQLNGCVNDVEAMKRALREPFRFPEENMTVLLNGEATRDRILAAMDGLVDRVGRDDVVVFFYSGHGSQRPCQDGDVDEEDGMVETIMPHDSGRGIHPNRDITDDEIYLWLQRLTARTRYVTLIFDCCHSGTIVRDDAVARGYEADTRPVPSSPVRTVPAAARKKGPSGWLPPGERYVLIAGCRAGEKAREVGIGDPPIHHGALTYHLVEELVRPASNRTYRDVIERCAPRVSALCPTQNVQLEGAWDREVFGVRTIDPMVFVGVRDRKGALVVLDAGAACGLTTGSEWEVYPSGTKKRGEVRPLGRVEITEVRAVTSDARILEESAPGAMTPGTRAVETTHRLGMKPLCVKVPEGSSPWLRALSQRIGESQLLKRAAPGETHDVRVRAVLSEESFALPGEEVWQIEAGDRVPLAPPQRACDPGSIDRLVQDLEKRARTRRLLSLRNDGSGLTSGVGFRLLRRRPDGSSEEPPRNGAGVPVFRHGDQIVLEIANCHELPLFLYVFNLGVSGGVGPIYPVRGAQKALSPGNTVCPGSRGGEEIDLAVLDETFEFWQKLGRDPLEGREAMVLFATTHPADFSPLYHPGLRESKGTNGLGDVLAAAFGRGRDALVRNQEAPDDWMTIDRTYILRREPEF